MAVVYADLLVCVCVLASECIVPLLSPVAHTKALITRRWRRQGEGGDEAVNGYLQAAK
jgi:hypothetical protein